MHGIDVDFGEERSGSCDNGGNEDLTGLTELAKVARSDEPDDVGMHVRPPKSFHNRCSGSVESFVSDVVVRTAHYFHATGR